MTTVRGPSCCWRRSTSSSWGRRLPVDVDGGAEVVEDLVERAEPNVVAPAVDEGGLDVEELFPEPFGDEFRDAGLAGAAGSGDK